MTAFERWIEDNTKEVEIKRYPKYEKNYKIDMDMIKTDDLESYIEDKVLISRDDLVKLLEYAEWAVQERGYSKDRRFIETVEELFKQ